MNRGLRIVLAVVLVVSALWLGGCASRVADGAILVDDYGSSPELRVVDVKRQTHEGVLLDITEEEWAQTDLAGDYLVITFSLETPEDALYGTTFYPGSISVGWDDEYVSALRTPEPFAIEVEPGESTTFQTTYELAPRGKVASVKAPSDVTVFYSGGIGTSGDRGDIARARDEAEVSVSLSELWSGGF